MGKIFWRQKCLWKKMWRTFLKDMCRLRKRHYFANHGNMETPISSAKTRIKGCEKRKPLQTVVQKQKDVKSLSNQWSVIEEKHVGSGRLLLEIFPYHTWTSNSVSKWNIEYHLWSMEIPYASVKRRIIRDPSAKMVYNVAAQVTL